MKHCLALLSLTAAATSLPVAAQPSTTVAPEKLLAHVRPAFSRPGTFLPAALRFPLRLDLLADLKAARAEVELHPDDLEARRRLAQLSEQVEDPAAEAQWREVLALLEPQLKKKPADAALLERQVEAMVGADLGIRVVPPAEKLRATGPQSWRVQLLYGDARLRRADFNWRVCVRLGDRAKSAPQFAELLGDLAAADAAYGKAAELAPAEGAVRGAKLSLTMARTVMASVLPKGALPNTEGLDVPALRSELIDLCRRNPGKVDPLWHTTHFLATFGAPETPLGAEDRAFLQRSLTQAQAADPAGHVFLAEARGMWAVAHQEWSVGRKAFEVARAAHPNRQFAVAWTALCDARCGEAPAAVIERVRVRLKTAETAEDYALLGLLLGSDDPEAAMQALRKAIDLDVHSANARYNLALLLLRRRADSAEARHHLRQAVELEPDNLEARLTQGVALALAGSTPAARQQLLTLKELPQADASLKERAAALLGLIAEPTR